MFLTYGACQEGTVNAVQVTFVETLRLKTLLNTDFSKKFPPNVTLSTLFHVEHHVGRNIYKT